MENGNGTQRELGVIQATLVAIQADLADAKSTRRAMYEKIDTQSREIIGVKNDVAAVRHAVDEMKPSVEEFKKLKHRGLGIMAGVAVAAGGVAAGGKAILAKLGIGS